LASRYLIQPCGAGKCRLVHLSRVDIMWVFVFPLLLVAETAKPVWWNHLCFVFSTQGPITRLVQ
jgi:hypothetical protein